MMNTTAIKNFILFPLGILACACVKDSNYDPAEDSCISITEINASYSDVKGLYQGETIEIREDLVIEGYVISSDKEGNIFGSLYFQDHPATPSEGFRIETDLRDAYLFYPPGSRIVLKLKGLYLGVSKGVYHLGGVFTAFGNKTVGRLPAAVTALHLFHACEPGSSLEAVSINQSELKENMVNTLIRLENMEFPASSLGQTFALPEKETIHELEDCGGLKLLLVNSGYANFQGETVPEGNGSIIGILDRDREDFHLIIRDLSDIRFEQERCSESGADANATQVFISELADPDNHPEARYVELYNSGAQDLPLRQWTLRRYTNANMEVSATLDLSGAVVPANSTLLIAADAMGFEAVYGFAPDVEAGSNGPADSNGDDTLALVDPSGTIIDIFGVIGEDGSGTNHEFEDGRAVRKPTVARGNPAYTFSEWEVYNDTGQAGTTNLPQQAPDDFNPGKHEIF